jgi:hypothetical protein
VWLASAAPEDINRANAEMTALHVDIDVGNDVEAGSRSSRAVGPEQIVQAATTIARHVHRNGRTYIFDLERTFAMDRAIDLGPLLDYAETQGWVTINGSRIIAGATEPALVTSATR